jgi:hypothetical protein
MAKIPGRLLVNLHPDGKVRIVFLPDIGGNDASPIKVTDLHAAEIIFMSCGLSVGHAAALRAEVTRNQIAAVDANVDEEVAAQFRFTFPAN